MRIAFDDHFIGQLNGADFCDPTHIKECSLVVATDGLWKYLNHGRIAKAAALRPLDVAVEALVEGHRPEGVRLWSGTLQDDVAVTLVEIK